MINCSHVVARGSRGMIQGHDPQKNVFNDAIWSVFDTFKLYFLSMLTIYKRNNHIKATRSLGGLRACFPRNFIFQREFGGFWSIFKKYFELEKQK